MAANERIEEHLNKNPLIEFSVYTDTQYKIIRALGEEIIRCLDKTISVDDMGKVQVRFEGKFTDDAYAKFWLWVLGAYEVVRTMCQAKACFVDEISKKLDELKQTLAVLRIPFAKQELKGVKGAVSAELSICSICGTPPDYLFRVGKQVVSVRELLGNFDEVLGSIRREDLVARHQASYVECGGSSGS